MPIVPSRSRDIQELIARLASPRAVERDSAAARLTLQAARAVDALCAALTRPGAPRAAILAVLEAIADRRALPAVAPLLVDDDPEVAARAVAATAACPTPAAAAALAPIVTPQRPRATGVRTAAVAALGRLHAAGVAEALEPLVERLLDRDEGEDVRVAAFEALAHLPAAERRRLVAAVRGATNLLLQRDAKVPRGSDSAWEASDPARLAATLRRQTEAGSLGGIAAIPRLHALLGALDARAAAGDAAGVTDAKAEVHAALASLASRIALYDLREMLERPPARALDVLLGAAGRVGDASFVAPIAAIAVEQAGLRDAARAALARILARESLGPRSRAVKGLPRPQRALLEELMPAKPGRGRSRDA